MRNLTQRAALTFRMAERRSRAASTEANGKSKNGKRKRERGRRKTPRDETSPSQIEPPVSPDGTHNLEGRRDGKGAMDGTMDGEKIPYELTLENTGNATVSDIDIADALADRGTLLIEWGGKTEHSLAPGETVKATATHTVTEVDIDAGIVENTAKANGKAPDGKPVESNTAKAAMTIEKRKPSIAIVKTGTERVSGDDVKPGTEIEFRFEVENNGNATLKGIAIDDALDGIDDIELDKTELAAGEKTSGTVR